MVGTDGTSVQLGRPAEGSFLAAIETYESIQELLGKLMSYAQLVDQVKADFNTADYYQGAYLINQAVNELCPAQIWQLRQSAAGYTLPPD